MESLNLSPEENKPSETDYQTITQAKSGANWFYWIAGLSLVNSLIFLFGGNWSFFAGLGITQIIDSIIDQLAKSENFGTLRIAAFVVDLLIAATFILCGLWANKFKVWAFIAGMILYLLDGLLLLILGAFLPAGFHLFALFMIFRGLAATRQINAASNS